MNLVLTVGLVSDTHIPDRVDQLHPHLLDELRKAGVGHILHAGDISSPAVLDALASVAPVTAVAGNRDWQFQPALPLCERLELCGVKIALLHGHGGFTRYVWDKFLFIKDGYILERYRDLLQRDGKGARVIVFGHTHFSECREVDGQLWINPGSACKGPPVRRTPTYGLLRIDENGEVEGEIRPLKGFTASGGRWIPVKTIP